MKALLLSCLTLLFLVSCSENEETTIQPENFTVSGKLLAPNNTDPISKGKVIVRKFNNTVKETTTDAQGNFSLNVPKGDYTITLSKGKFSTQRDIIVSEENDIMSFTLDTLPKIAVVTGSYDNIENVLYNIGLVNPITQEPLFDIVEGINIAKTTMTHDHSRGTLENKFTNPNLTPNVDFDFGDLIASPELLAEYDIIFLNCGLDESKTEHNENLLEYVNNGGILYTTDWAFKYLSAITNDNTEHLEFYEPEKSGVSLSTEATLLDEDAIEWLFINFGITIDNIVEIEGFLPQWQVVNSFDADTTLSWLNGPIEYKDENGDTISENKDLAFTFLVGDGGVFYSSFHTHATIEGFTDLDRIMEFFVFELSAL